MSDTVHQHHVQRAYLEAWCGEDGKLALAVGENVVPHRVSPRSCAARRSFYGLQLLRPGELRCLVDFMSRIQSQDTRNWLLREIITYHIQKMRLGESELLDSLKAVKDAVDFGEQQKDVDRILCAPGFWMDNGERQRYENAVRQSEKVGFEDFHTNIESKAFPLVKRARDGDLSFLNDRESAWYFVCYIYDHFSRTLGFLDPREINKSFENFDAEGRTRIASYIRYVIPLVYANGFSNNGDFRFALIENKTGHEFITGDQPVVNTSTAGTNVEDSTRLFFPLSPTRAVCFGHKDRLAGIPAVGIEICEDRVKALNNHLCNASREQVYASSIQFLEDNGYRARGIE